jgi:single-stranded-DNA-specific exonuclease
MAQAVDRLLSAIEQGEKIAVYGDYDVDGVTATTLLVQVLERLGAQVEGYIPNRFEEGYGLNKEALKSLFEKGVSLVVTVDCGIRSLAEAEEARRLGLDLIITDHHHPAAELPGCLATINPKQQGCSYADKDLAGVGLAYKLAEGLIAAQRERGPALPVAVSAAEYLDLVALGTVADLAPLVGENRYLVRAGLRCLRQPLRAGTLALMNVAGLNIGRMTATDIGFMLGPRLNASGRLESAMAAYNLLRTSDRMEAGKLAQQLDNQNRERQTLTRQIQSRAEELALVEEAEPLLLFAVDESFNSGVVGLAASRLTETYYRPAVVAQRGEEFTRGSCRSIPEFHITAALDQCEDILVRHGGHAMAAGFTVRNENVAELAARLKAIAQETLSGQDLRQTLAADADVQISELDYELMKFLDLLQPTGYGNSPAIFVSRNLQVRSSRAVGKDSSHLKLAVSDGWATCDAIAFRKGEWLGKLPNRIDLMYTFELNEYNGRTSFQLNVKDLKPSGQAD